ncbi:hypothetical protein CONLIGDRAFT_101757 [Coniochaeta ligniaria NRRL 30616]|uniref:Uncharacterized protein n=1 Tax=Coniochaeta ligniaria NRRL 30616 TaxID=1408157 RepID=A0A1J7J4A7_9PEZI|nr:hypothetical protein CONLIGDRAFT_101757 [Coniochaeta ligniaria NRRL 30616]
MVMTTWLGWSFAHLLHDSRKLTPPRQSPILRSCRGCSAPGLCLHSADYDHSQPQSRRLYYRGHRASELVLLFLLFATWISTNTRLRLFASSSLAVGRPAVSPGKCIPDSTDCRSSRIVAPKDTHEITDQ